MPKQTQLEIEQIIHQIRLANPDIVRRHVVDAIRSPIAYFTVKTSEFYQVNGVIARLLCLSGTVECNYRGNCYNIPIEIFFREDYPNVSPLVYVRPTPNMYIPPSNKDVQSDGELIIPYIRQWNHLNNNIDELLTQMSKAFSLCPPAYTKPMTASSSASHATNSSLYSSLPPKAYVPATNVMVSSSSSKSSLPITHNSSSSATASSNMSESSHVHRFSDLADEPLDILLPIQGYEKFPIVSLEEAIIPLESIVEDVEQMVWITKQKCLRPKDGLTSDESASIMLYTMEWEPCDKSFYILLNKTLRSAKRDKLKPWFSYLRLVVHAFQKLPSINHTIYRGINGNLSDEYRRGETIIWWGFSSCTKSIETLNNEQFLGKTGARTFFSIECESSKNIRSHSFYEDEEEILLLPGRQFEIIGCIDQGNGFKLVQLKETKPKFPLLKLP